ncbi:hypothetical protein [Streptomyces sp. NPDC055992]
MAQNIWADSHRSAYLGWNPTEEPTYTRHSAIAGAGYRLALRA